MLELFSEAVRVSSFWESHRKQYAWRHFLDGKDRERARAEGREPPPPLEPPWLWLVSAGRPEALLVRYPLRPWPRFPTGIYLFDDGWRIGLIVVNELPPVPETLVLRLMGSPAVRRAAIAEIGRLPDGDPDRLKLQRLLKSLQHTFQRATNISQEEKDEFMTAARAEVERLEQKIRQDGIRDGRQEGLCSAIIKFCARAAIPLKEERRKQFQTMDAEALEQLYDYLLEHRAWPQP